jgi:hypothetical protein
MTIIGMNLAAIDYSTTEAPFIDRMKTSAGWDAKDASGKVLTTGWHLDANNNPVSDNPAIASFNTAVALDPLNSQYSTTYVLTYSGTATVTINAQTVSSVPGKLVFKSAASGDLAYVVPYFKNISPTDPIHDIHIVRSDQVDLFNAGKVFNPDFVQKTSQWGVVRTMDWQEINNLEDVTWANRATLTDASWAGRTQLGGVPTEIEVKLANEAHVDLWYVVPTKADDNYVTQAMTYIRDNLDPTLKVHVEYSNEVWNTGFSANGYSQSRANALWSIDANKNGMIEGAEAIYGGQHIYYGYRAAQIASIARKVFGADAQSRLVTIIAGQAANASLLSYILQGAAKVGTPSSLFNDYAIAPYFGGEVGGAASKPADHAIVLGWANSGAAGIDAAFKQLEFGGQLSSDQSLKVVSGWIANSAAVAKNAGLNLVAYEGGESILSFAFPAAEQDLMTAFFGKLSVDPRMGDLYTKLVTDFAAKGGTKFVAFDDVNPISKWGNWGALTNIYQGSSPKYDALAKLSAAQKASIPTPAPVQQPIPTPAPHQPAPASVPSTPPIARATPADLLAAIDSLRAMAMSMA